MMNEKNMISKYEDYDICIYGAGELGKKLCSCFDYIGTRVSMFIVSEHSDDESVLGIPIYDFQKALTLNIETKKIYVAMNKKYHDDVRNNLKKIEGIDLEKVYFWDAIDVFRFYREVHEYNFSDVLLTSRPISEEWGYDRGTPIDRYYISNFLQSEKVNNKLLNRVKKVLEVGDLRYSSIYYPLAKGDILDHSVGMDLTKNDTLPKEEYDLFICTQTFHQIYEIDKAIEGAWHLLKHGGVMLATTCGCITKLANNSDYTHYWGLTEIAFNKMLKEVFGDNVTTKSYGNAMAATAFIQGLSVEDVDSKILDETDPDFSICISGVAVKD